MRLDISSRYAFFVRIVPLLLSLCFGVAIYLAISDEPAPASFVYSAETMEVLNSPICGDAGDAIQIRIKGSSAAIPTWSTVELSGKIMNRDTGAREYVYPTETVPQPPQLRPQAMEQAFDFVLHRTVPHLPPGKYTYVHMATNLYPGGRGIGQGFSADFEVVSCSD